jgi:hypothetical protein
MQRPRLSFLKKGLTAPPYWGGSDLDESAIAGIL